MIRLKDFVFLFLISICFGQPYYSKKLNVEAGLFFEPLYNVRIARGHWELISSINFHSMNFFTQEINTSPLIKNTLDACQTIFNKNWCQEIIKTEKNTLNVKINRMNEYLKQIDEIINQSEDIQISRKRSAPLSIIGAVSRSLFGTLNEQDAERYDRILHQLVTDQQKMSLLVANQTHAVRSGFHILEEKMIQNLNEMRRNNTKLIRELINSTTTELKELEKRLYLIKMKQVIGGYEQITDQFLHSLEKILEAIMFGNLGLIHPDLLPAKQLQIAVNHLLNKQGNFIFPLHKKQLSVIELSKISKITIGHYKRRLTLVIRVPLIENEQYQLYKLYPYPTNQAIKNSSGSAFIQPSTSHLLLSKSQEKYSLIQEIDLLECKPTNHFHICELRYPIYDINSQSTCEVGIITKAFSNPHKICDIKVSSTFNPYWRYLRQTQGWLYALPETEEIKIIYDNQLLITLQLSGSGILLLQSGCIAKTKYATIFGYKTLHEIITFNYDELPITNLNLTEILPAKINFTTNAQLENISKRTTPGILDYDATLMDLEQEFIELSTYNVEDPASNFTVGTLSLHAITLIILLILMLFFGRKYITEFFRTFCCCHPKYEKGEERSSQAEEIKRRTSKQKPLKGIMKRNSLYDTNPKNYPVVRFEFNEPLEVRTFEPENPEEIYDVIDEPQSGPSGLCKK